MNNGNSSILYDLMENPRKYIKVLAFFMLSLMAMLFVLPYIFKGSLTVKTSRDDTNTIAIRDPKGKVKTIKSTEKYTARLGPGSYLITVSGKKGTTMQEAHVKARKSLSYDMQPSLPPSIEPVLADSAHSLAIGPDHIYYVSLSDSKLYKLGVNSSASTTPVVASSISLASVSWENADYGIAISTDGKHMYSIQNDNAVEVELPFDNGPNILYSLNSKGVLYVAQSGGQYVYKKDPKGEFIKLDPKGSPTYPITSITASDNNVVVKRKASEDSELKKSTYLEVLNIEGKLVAKRDKLPDQQVFLSSDGEKIVLSGKDSSTMYDVSLKKSSLLPNADISELKWIDGNTIIYSSGPDLFSYNPSDGSISNIARTGINSKISDIYIDHSGGYIYIEHEETAADGGVSHFLSRASTNKKDVPRYLYGLNSFFPAVYNDCSFSYINFVSPTIMITTNNPGSDCYSSARIELKQDNLPLEGFTLVDAPVLTSESE